MPHDMAHAEFLALRYCHPKGEMNPAILNLLIGLRLSHFIAPPRKPKMGSALNPVNVGKTDAKENRDPTEALLALVEDHAELKAMFQQSQTTVKELTAKVTKLETDVWRALVKADCGLRATVAKVDAEVKRGQTEVKASVTKLDAEVKQGQMEVKDSVTKLDAEVKQGQMEVKHWVTDINSSATKVQKNLEAVALHVGLQMNTKTVLLHIRKSAEASVEALRAEFRGLITAPQEASSGQTTLAKPLFSPDAGGTRPVAGGEAVHGQAQGLPFGFTDSTVSKPR